MIREFLNWFFFAEIKCAKDEFQCDSGKCIRKSDVCDRYHDCGAADNSDERNCTGGLKRISINLFYFFSETTHFF